MGLDLLVPRREPLALDALLAELAAAGLPSTILMVDRQMVSPRAAPPTVWSDVRLRTPAGMVTLSRRPDGIAVVVFGNAEPSLVEAQRKIAALLEPK